VNKLVIIIVGISVWSVHVYEITALWQGTKRDVSDFRRCRMESE